MRQLVSLNLKCVPAKKALVSGLSPAAFYGKGVFTTLAVNQQKPFLWERHWARLSENASRLGIDASAFPEQSAKEALAETIAANKIRAGRARLTLIDESANALWNFDAGRQTSLLITAAARRPLPAASLRLNLSPFPLNSQSALAGIKSCNYLENLLAYENARREGFDEALRLTEKGKIASAAMANVFWIKRGKIFTPSLETGCLAGTTRGFLLEAAQARGFEVYQVQAGAGEIRQADEIFLTSSGIGVQSVGRFEDLTFDDRLTSELRSIFEAAATAI